MPSPPAYADLEIYFIIEAPYSYRVDVHFRLASSAIDADLTAGAASR